MKKNFKKNILVNCMTATLSIISISTLSNVLLLNNANAQEQNIQSVIKFKLNKDIEKVPSLFNIYGSNRLIIDFYNVDKNTGIPLEIKDTNILNSKLVFVENRGRLILETKHPVKYGVSVNGKEIRITLEKAKEFENISNLNKIDNKEEVKIETKEVSKQKIETKELAPITVAMPLKSQEPIQINKEKIENKSSVEKKEVSKEVAKFEEVMADVKKDKSNNLKVLPSLIQEVEKVNIKNTGNKSARITIDLSDKNIVPIINKLNDKLIIDLNGVSIPASVQKRLLLDEVGTVVKSIDVSMQKNNGHIVLEQKDGWDYSFSQMDKQVVIDIKPQQKVEEQKKYNGKTISLNFQNMDVKAILQVIADFTGLNIMASDSVQGGMTIRLKDVPWDQALDLVLEAKNLQKIKDGNVIWIATRQEIAETNKAKLELKTQNENLDPLILEFFQINYYKASELKAVLEGKSDSSNGGSSEPSVRILSKRGSIGVDLRNNMLFIQDTPDNMREIKKLISKIDIPVRQVLVEAKIVIADDKFGREIGSRFGIRSRGSVGNTSIGIGGNITESGSVAGGSTASVTPLTNLSAVGSNTVLPGVIGMTLLGVGGDALGLELSALEQNNRGKVVSNPRLITTDNKQATIEQGTEIPYVTPGSSGSPATVAFKKAVLSLGVTPQIAPNGKIVMSLKIRKDTIGDLINIQGGGQIPSIDTKNIDTQVTVSDGQTVVLGGVYEISNRNDLSKIPFFGDLPILGNLFKNTNKIENKGELLMFITPIVVTDDDLQLNNTLPTTINEVNLRKIN